ncbi:MAG: aminotransferase class I/II-fold pyridoxal phosphate-dependent enzyme [Xenococcaceae cyanobacterium]
MQLPAFKLERFFAQYEFLAPYLLCSSDCEAMTIEELLSLESGAASKFHQTWLGYTETQGNPELRQAVTGIYQNMGIDDILIHASAEEAIFIFMNVALKAGEHLIVHYPCYQSHISIARSIGCQVSEWRSFEADDWDLDLDWLQGAIQHWHSVREIKLFSAIEELLLQILKYALAFSQNMGIFLTGVLPKEARQHFPALSKG